MPHPYCCFTSEFTTAFLCIKLTRAQNTHTHTLSLSLLSAPPLATQHRHAALLLKFEISAEFTTAFVQHTSAQSTFSTTSRDSMPPPPTAALLQNLLLNLLLHVYSKRKLRTLSPPLATQRRRPRCVYLEDNKKISLKKRIPYKA